jgi:hypothetical protein
MKVLADKTSTITLDLLTSSDDSIPLPGNEDTSRRFISVAMKIPQGDSYPKMANAVLPC